MTELSVDQHRRLNALRREVVSSQRALRAQWIQRLSRSSVLDVPNSGMFPIGHQVPSGGFRVPLIDLTDCTSAVKDFLREHGRSSGEWIETRGFSYYAADASMYRSAEVPTDDERLQKVLERQSDYRSIVPELIESVIGRPLQYSTWLCSIAVLEYVVNDAWTLHWTRVVADDGLDLPLPVGLRAMTELIVWLAWHTWNDACHLRTPDRELATWRRAHAEEPSGGVVQMPRTRSVRAIREGDQLPLIFAGFERKGRAVMERYPNLRMVLASEAFGAIHLGHYWAAMWPDDLCDRPEIVLTRSSIHEAEMQRMVHTLSSPVVSVDGAVVLHLDDSVFTGRTHDAFLAGLSGTPAAVHLASLTVDLGTPVNHPEEMTWDGRSVDEHLRRLERLARDCDGQLPAGFSFWARRKSEVPSGTSDPEWRRIVGGSDRLLANLWSRLVPTKGS